MSDRISESSYIPNCVDEFKPFKGRVFGTLVDGINFYRQYGRVAGFDTRMSTSSKVDDRIIWKYVLCSREGDKFTTSRHVDSNKKRRKHDSMRCGCTARVVFKYEFLVGYVIHSFIEEHNHPLIEDQFKHFMKLNSKIDYVHQKFILDCAKTNIGPTKSHKLLMEFLGGYDGVGCSTLDVRNYSRDMNAFVDGADAQMLLNEFQRKKGICSSFTFDYEVDSNQRLQRLFWCDSVSKKNYKLFGDVVAFDTTYSINKYCMIFAPFTGKDNHGKPVTFASALLSKEDSDSFCWLFEKFISCVGVAPRMIITDQDLGMKVAIERVLIGTRHQWCMWHIMLKLADKVSKELHSNEDFKDDLKSYVWSDLIVPEQFEEGWYHIMVNYGLEGDKWFETMFESRDYWVPAFFRDFSFSGLMRTTSISECENHFYKSFTKFRSNLLQFLMNFNHAIDSQRNSSSHMDYLDSAVVCKLKTGLLIEKQASLVYTSNMFASFQIELVAACNSCRISEKKKSVGDGLFYKIIDAKKDIFCVVYNADDETYVCDCNMFIRIGLLCSHICAVFKNEDIVSIPDKYIVNRWKMTSLLNLEYKVLNPDYSAFDGNETKVMEIKIMRAVMNCLGRIDGDKKMLKELLCGIQDLDETIISCDDSVLKKRMFEGFYGAEVLEEIEVLPPVAVKTKGSGSRVISRKEKAQRMMEKAKRMCAKCKKLTYHDSRNCDKVNKKLNKDA